MAWSDNPVADFERYDAEQERNRARYPICSCCGEHIQDETLYDINGELFCPDCIEDFSHPTESYME